MTLTIKPNTHLPIKGLLLTLLLSALMSETVQAQAIPNTNIPTITLPNISVIQPSITVRQPTIVVPQSTVNVNIPKIPSVATPENNIFQLPIKFVVNGAAGNTRPSFVSAIQEGNNQQIQTAIAETIVTNNNPASTTITIPAATSTSGTVSSINVVVPSTKTVSSGDVNFNVNTTEIPPFGSVVNSANLSFPLPVLD